MSANFRSEETLPNPGRFAAWPALITFMVALVLGLGVVWWRASSAADTAKGVARTELQAKAAALELQFSRVVTAAEALGAAARQSGGAMPNFQQAAAELLRTHPGLASLEWQPGGVVRDVLPRLGNERLINFNVLADPVHRIGANAAWQAQGLSVTRPLELPQGGQGIIARVPFSQRGRDGKATVWGFVSASIRTAAALEQAHLKELGTKGYDYFLFAPPTSQQETVVIAASGKSFDNAVSQTVRVHNYELTLAARPRGGWISKITVTLEVLGVLLVAGLLGLLVQALLRGHEVETALAEASSRLTRETEDRKRIEDERRSANDAATAAQAELKQTRSALNKAEAMIPELQARMEAAVRSAKENSESLQSRVKEAELKASTLQARLDDALQTSDHAVEAKQAELENAEAALRQARQRIGELDNALAAATRVEKQTAVAAQARHEQDQAMIASLQAQLNEARQAAEQTGETKQAELENTAAALQQARQRIGELEDTLAAALRVEKQNAASAEARHEQDQAIIKDLQARLEEAKKGADTAAQDKQAELEQTQASLWQARQRIIELEKSLIAAATQAETETTTTFRANQEQHQARIADLEARLEAATRAAQEAEEAKAAGVAKLEALEESHRDLEQRLREAEQDAAKLAELTALLEQTRQELAHERAVVASRMEIRPADLVPPRGIEAEGNGNEIPDSLVSPEEPSRAPISETPVVELPVAEIPETAAEEAVEIRPVSESHDVAPPSEPAEAELGPTQENESVPMQATEVVEEPPPAAVITETQVEIAPPVEEKPAKTTKRKRNRRDAQMDLFGAPAPAPAEPAAAEATGDAAPVLDAPVIEATDVSVEAGPVADTPAPPVTVEPEPEVIPVAAVEEIPVESKVLEEPVPEEIFADLEAAAPAPEKREEGQGSAVVPGLPEIEGLAVAEGLARVGDNPKLYLKTLRHFVDHQAGISEQIREALEQGNSMVAIRMVEALEAAATDIGATRVRAAAVALSRAVQDQAEPDQIESLWSELEKAQRDLVAELKPALPSKEEKPAPARAHRPPPPVNPAELRKVVNQIVPLFAGEDPGAKDCFKDNRATFRSAFTPEGYAEFEQMVKSGDYSAALEHLRKAARKHGVSV